MRVKALLRRRPLAVCTLLATACATPPATDTPRPNVVLILVDDLGWRDIGAYGQDVAQTPNLDALARQSQRYTQAYAANPVCSPTRAALMTGKHPSRIPIDDWIPGTTFPTARMLAPRDRDELPLAETTLAEALRARGYTTWHVGKWHLGGEGFLPENQGFDVNWMGSHIGHPASHFFPYDAGKPGHSHTVTRLPPGGATGDYLADAQARAAAELLRTAAADHRPFYLQLSFYAVHAPIEAKPADVARHRQLAAATGRGPDARPRPAFAAMLENLDAAVGKVLAALDEHGLADDTIVVFTSDNGGLATVSENAPLRGGKRSLWEGGLRVPLLVRWPGVVPAGTECALPVVTQDVHRGLRSAAGAAQDPVVAEDAFDLARVWRGEPVAARGPIYWHFPQHETVQTGPRGAIRDGDWKLIEDLETGQGLLFHLSRDPGEAHDLAAAEPGRTRELLDRLRTWRAHIGAQMPTVNPRYTPAAPESR
jgi:arylsulfatase A-like enzyme